MLKRLNPAGKLVTSLFEYNRKNYDEDREQRQSMEYQVMAMRIEQTALWREDIRAIIEFTQTKVEMYMLVSTLLLGFCATAIVKAIVFADTPEWLISAHTLLLCGSFMFLLLSMIIGINAYVASQAYMVRLNTQYVRLPIPTWANLEACRTYGSTIEKQKGTQLFRVPFAQGQQERAEQLRQDAARHEPPPTSLLPSRGSPRASSPGGGRPRAGGGAATSDPWGLERRGDNIPELHPLVNTNCAKQRHIWLAREAGKFYLTHEAFCRVAMSVGISYQAMFFAYYCLTYCLVEDGAPAAALVGMLICVCLSMANLYMEITLADIKLILLFMMQVVPPLLNAITIYMSSPNGDAGVWEYFACIGHFIQGSWLFVFLLFLRVRETDTGVFFPTAYKSALLLDTFGHHPHQPRVGRQSGTAARALLNKSKAASLFPGVPAARGKGGKLDNMDEAGKASLPSMGFVDGPFRPEDASAEHAKNQNILLDSLSPDTFFAGGTEEDERGNILHGRKPGEQVWRVFRMAASLLAVLWWASGGYSLYCVSQGWGHLKHIGSWETQAERATITSVALLGADTRSWRTERVQTRWPSAMARPTGLACDAAGAAFATAGRGKRGRKAVLHGRVTEDGAAPPRGYSRSKLVFTTAPACPELQVEGRGELIRDLALHRCTEPDGCRALVLPEGGASLVSCRLAGDEEGESDIMADSAAGLSLFQRAAMYRRINVEDTVPNVDRVLAQDALKKNATKFRDQLSDILAEGFLKNASVPLARAWLDDYAGEEPSSLSMAPCQSMEGGPSECPVLGTSAGRAVQLGPGHVGDGEAAWVPRRTLLEVGGRAIQPGAFAEVGGGKLGVLHDNGRHVRLFGTALGGAADAAWRLPAAPKGLQWASVCAGGDAVYALDNGENPDLWRFTRR